MQLPISNQLKQSKHGRHVVIPVASPLKAELDAAAMTKRAVTILTTTKGTPWTSDGFRTECHKAASKAKISGLTFRDLRGTAVSRLTVAGCSEAGITNIAAHSLRDVGAILDIHCVSRNTGLAESAIRKSEAKKRNGNTHPSAQLLWTALAETGLTC